MALLQADSGPVAAPTPFERLGDGLRRRWRAVTRSREAATSVRLRRVLRQEELRGLAFAFRARSIAAVAVALWLVLLVPAPRVFYYLGVVALFFILGLVPHFLRGHRHGQIFKLAFILLDVLLIVAVILTRRPSTARIGRSRRACAFRITSTFCSTSWAPPCPIRPST
jgi:hypothetical protein